jgi:hypothetical protein
LLSSATNYGNPHSYSTRFVSILGIAERQYTQAFPVTGVQPVTASTSQIIPATTEPKPPVAYSIPEAARAASIGTTKLRNEIRAGRLRVRKLGKRSIITTSDLEKWAAALPDIRDVAPDTAAAALNNFRKSA